MLSSLARRAGGLARVRLLIPTPDLTNGIAAPGSVAPVTPKLIASRTDAAPSWQSDKTTAPAHGGPAQPRSARHPRDTSCLWHTARHASHHES
jgi:hypothetical protein